MAHMSKQKVEIIAVAVLVVIAAAVAYLRFGRKPSAAATARQPRMSESSLMEIEVPTLPDWVKTSLDNGTTQAVSYVAPARDIFCPGEEAEQRPGDPRRPGHTPGGLPVLTGITWGPAGGLAVLNGRVVAQGEKVGKYTVTEIAARHVVLTDGETSHEISMEHTAAGSGPAEERRNP